MTTQSVVPPPRLRLVLIGAGKVGTSVAELLRRAGHSLTGVASRSSDSAARAAAILDCATFDFPGPLPRCDVILVGTPDAAIPEVARALTEFVSPDHVVVHFAGTWGLDVLGPVLDAGARGAALHPAQAVPDVDAGLERIPGSAWGVTCSEGLEPLCRSLVADLEGEAILVAEEDRALWHAAAASASNGIAALLAVAEAALREIGVDRPARVLGPLARGAVANALRDGGSDSLTGPAVRGDARTIELHLDAMAEREGLARSYAQVTRLVLDVARRAGRVDDDAAASIDELLHRALTR